MALAYEMELSREEFKAWSQSLGLENLETSFNNYGPVSLERQRMRMLAMHEEVIEAMDESRAKLIVDVLAVIDARKKVRVG